jgi:hypothetical protein
MPESDEFFFDEDFEPADGAVVGLQQQLRQGRQLAGAVPPAAVQ